MKVDIVESVDLNRLPNANDHLLVRELTHRVKNEFASVIGLVSLIAARSASDEIKQAFSGVTSLLHNYAGVHRALQMPTYGTVINASDYIRALCQSIRRARLDHREINFELVEQTLYNRYDGNWTPAKIVGDIHQT